MQYLGELGAELEVVRNDAASVDDLLGAHAGTASSSRRGPCTPNEAGISVEAMRRFPEAGVPTLGVCLGHQSLAQAFGGKVVRHLPVHGKTTEIEHDGTRAVRGAAEPAHRSGAITRSWSTPSCPTCSSRRRGAAAC